MNSKIDLHMHSNFSDGSDGIEELISHVKDKDICIFALTDHDTIAGCQPLAGLVPEEIQFLYGVEFSCYTEAGKCHILGYQYDPAHPSIRAALEEGKLRRRQKFELRLAYLQEVQGISFTQEEIDGLRAIESVGRPHLGRLLVKKGIAENIDKAIRTYINGCKTGNDRIPADMAIQAILAAGGIPVWAHPLGGEGEKRLTEEQFDRQLELLAEMGIRGLECYYSRYTMEEVSFLLSHAERRGLLVSGGSDYHGKNKTVPMGRLNAEDIVITREKLSILDALGL
ncbi:MAG: PHP domain-containing protein [Eubacteriales bacterium]|nr:PHP domain-containing protein [Eubacteriales bacterium]